MTLWATADQHFDHKPIIRFSNRPFEGLNEMHKAIIDRWNERVADSDTVFVLGDFSFGPYPWALDALKGHLHLIQGNHDHKKTTSHSRWESVQPYKEQRHGGVKFIMCHYPFESWKNSRHGSIHLHGHCHGNSRKVTNRWDVGVDCFDFAPVEFDWFLKRRELQGPYRHSCFCAPSRAVEFRLQLRKGHRSSYVDREDGYARAHEEHEKRVKRIAELDDEIRELEAWLVTNDAKKAIADDMTEQLKSCLPNPKCDWCGLREATEEGNLGYRWCAKCDFKRRS